MVQTAITGTLHPLSDQMGRFAATIAFLAVLLLFGAPAGSEAAGTAPRVAILCVPSCSGTTFEALLDELRNLGWVENATIVLERMEAGSRLDQLPVFAADLVRSKPDPHRRVHSSGSARCQGGDLGHTDRDALRG
jgi:hypothetical protein